MLVLELGGTELVLPALASLVVCDEPTPVLDGLVLDWSVLPAAGGVVVELDGGCVEDGL